MAEENMSVSERWENRLNTQNDKPDVLYADWSQDYDTVLQSWDYDLPERCVKRLIEHTQERVSILDCGCGTGLVGSILQKHGFSDIYGLDASAQMLEVCKEKSVYESLEVADLTKPFLTDEADKFSSILCVGTMTYLTTTPENTQNVFDCWLRLGKPNCMVVMTQRSDLCTKDFIAQVELQPWKILFQSEPEPYLPRNKSYDNKKVVTFVLKFSNRDSES